MLKLTICDDDKDFAVTLAEEVRQLLAFFNASGRECTVDSIVFSADQLLSRFSDSPTDILFLDIDMPSMSGFETARIINERYPNTVILFVSSHDSFVYQSFEYNPFRFLRKSHLSEELPTALEKALGKCTETAASVMIKATEGDCSVRIKDIICIESTKNYYTVSTASGHTYRCRGTMESATEIFEAHGFLRPHVAFLVNPEQVDSLRKRNELLMKNGTVIPISSKRSASFCSEFHKYTRRRMFR